MSDEGQHLSPGGDIRGKTLAQCVSQALDGYFSQLGGEDTSNLYQLVLSEVERPMLESVMTYVSGSRTRAARILGMSRGTLRKKLQQYGLD
jgi:Fis family transcriptional regulator